MGCRGSEQKTNARIRKIKKITERKPPLQPPKQPPLPRFHSFHHEKEIANHRKSSWNRKRRNFKRRLSESGVEGNLEGPNNGNKRLPEMLKGPTLPLKKRLEEGKTFEVYERTLAREKDFTKRKEAKKQTKRREVCKRREGRLRDLIRPMKISSNVPGPKKQGTETSSGGKKRGFKK